MPKATNERIDDCLSVRRGRLFIEAAEASALARQFGTPLYVVSEDQLRRNARRFRRAFEAGWSEAPVNILASAKANFTLSLLRILAQEGTGCDTFGSGEFFAALRAGFPPALISVNGATKDRPILVSAIEAGARITLDSATEVRLAREVARSLGVRARVRFRIRPRYEALDQPSDFYENDVPISLAANRYKPGIPTEDLFKVGPEALDAPELEVTGVMAHLGRHGADLELWRGMVRSFVALVAELSEKCGGWEPAEIDLGGGFATARDPTGRTTRRGQARPSRQLAPSIEDYAATLTSALKDELVRKGLQPKGKTLEVEPGRSLFADAGIHLAKVRGIKEQTGFAPRTWIETDTTEMFLLDTIVEHNRWTTIVAEKADMPGTRKVDVVGISCGFDLIADQASLPQVDVGDTVAFLDTGAYQDACSNNFNALPRPAVVLVHGSEAEVVKRAETIEDVFRRDTVPSRLGVLKRVEETR